jgi:outer membrane protein assembly factor BamD (BamD/ComL family)
MYNQGVVLFNAGKYADAKGQFEAATKADPTNANAFYQLGMTSLNLGQIPDAVAALETFIKLAPTDPKAAQVQGSLPALRQMLPK